MKDDLIKWVAESDPLVSGVCFYCKTVIYARETTGANPYGTTVKRGDHAPGCWYVRCRANKPGDVIKNVIGPGGETL